MPARNHELTFRPVQGGILIINPANDRPGTLGAIATRNGADRFALSCYHVLCRPNGGSFADGEVILQSLSTKGGSAIGRVFASDTRPLLDVAAARVESGVPTYGRIIGLGPLDQPRIPAVGMHVLKAGCATGVTQGVVSAVNGDRVEIQRRPGFPSMYELSDFGDSGALWVEDSTGRPVAMHTGASPAQSAIAASINPLLAALSLTLVLDA